VDQVAVGQSKAFNRFTFLAEQLASQQTGGGGVHVQDQLAAGELERRGGELAAGVGSADGDKPVAPEDEAADNVRIVGGGQAGSGQEAIVPLIASQPCSVSQPR